MTNTANTLQEFWFRESREFRDRAMTETAKRRSAYEARDTRDPPRGRSPSREDAEVGYTPRSVRSFQLRSFSEPHMAGTKSPPCDSLAVTPRRSEVPSTHLMKPSGEGRCLQTPRIRVAAQHLPINIINGHPKYPNQVPLSTVERRSFSKGSKGSTGPTGPPRSKSSGLSRKSAVGSVGSIPSVFVQWGATPVFAGWQRSKPTSNEGYAQKHQRRQNSTPATPVGALRQVSSPKALTKSSPMPKPIRPTTTGLSAKLVNAETLKAENAALREELARANLAPLMQLGYVGTEVVRHCRGGIAVNFKTVRACVALSVLHCFAPYHVKGLPVHGVFALLQLGTTRKDLKRTLNTLEHHVAWGL